MSGQAAAAGTARHPTRPHRALDYRLSHAITGALLGCCLAATLLAVQSGSSRYTIVAISALSMAGLGYLVGRSQDRLWATSLTDPLTGLANRRYFDRRTRALLSGASRHDFSIALLLIDVDRLKDINDRLGHRAGDEALRAVAATLERTCRSIDVAARCGGDEFAVLAQFTNTAAASELAKRIRCELPMHVQTSDATASLSVSIGIAVTRCRGVTTQSQVALAAARLFAAADRAMYAAKARGRDCCSAGHEQMVDEQAVEYPATDRPESFQRPPAHHAAPLRPNERR